MNPYALLDPAVALLHQLLVAVAGALPIPDPGVRFAVALAVLTAVVRALLVPLSVRSLRARRAREALAPQLARLQKRHAGDPRRLLAETSRVHREAGTSPYAGMLPALAQLPVVATLYRLVIVPTVAGAPNRLLTAHLFGAPMAAHWPEVVAAGGVLGPGSLALLALLLALTGLAFVSARELTGVARLLPFGTVVLAVLTPMAVGVYLLVSTSWTVTERRLLPRLVPAAG